MSEQLLLDHLVYATPDLAETVRSLAAVGVPLVPGGPHVDAGTRNHLTGIGGGAYLEVVGPDLDQPDPPGPRPFGIDGLTAPRLVTWAVRTTDLDAALVAAAAAGHPAGRARPMSRQVPGGALLRWRLAFPPQDDGGLLPFLIDWGTTEHPANALPDGVRLAGLRGTHPEPGPVTERLAALGVDLPVERADAIGLSATLHTADGTVHLG